MLIRETVRRCDVCHEVTPHGRRLVSGPLLLAALLLIVAGWSASLENVPTPVGVSLLLASVLLFLRDRRRCWRMQCERCRAKQRAALRATKPALDGSTEIGIF